MPRLEGERVVARRCQIRVFAADELRRIKECRRRPGRLLVRSCFPIGQGLKWMPHSARPSFECEWDELAREEKSVSSGHCQRTWSGRRNGLPEHLPLASLYRTVRFRERYGVSLGRSGGPELMSLRQP